MIGNTDLDVIIVVQPGLVPKAGGICNFIFISLVTDSIAKLKSIAQVEKKFMESMSGGDRKAGKIMNGLGLATGFGAQTLLASISAKSAFPMWVIS